jgi:transcription antitermination factor NusG
MDYVGRAKSGMMKVAEASLVAAGFGFFSPRIVGEDGETTEALFGRYFFVSCSGSRADFGKINNSRGVARLMPLHLEEPLRLPEGYLPRLRKALEEDAANLSKAEEVAESFSRGQSVLVKCGSYAGVSGTFEKRKKGLLEITFALLGRNHVVCVPQQNVTARPIENVRDIRGRDRVRHRPGSTGGTVAA